MYTWHLHRTAVRILFCHLGRSDTCIDTLFLLHSSALVLLHHLVCVALASNLFAWHRFFATFLQLSFTLSISSCYIWPLTSLYLYISLCPITFSDRPQGLWWVGEPAPIEPQV